MSFNIHLFGGCPFMMSYSPLPILLIHTIVLYYMNMTYTFVRILIVLLLRIIEKKIKMFKGFLSSRKDSWHDLEIGKWHLDIQLCLINTACVRIYYRVSMSLNKICTLTCCCQSLSLWSLSFLPWNKWNMTQVWCKPKIPLVHSWDFKFWPKSHLGQERN